MESVRGSLILEAIALPTEPQPLPKTDNIFGLRNNQTLLILNPLVLKISASKVLKLFV